MINILETINFHLFIYNYYDVDIVRSTFTCDFGVKCTYIGDNIPNYDFLNAVSIDEIIISSRDYNIDDTNKVSFKRFRCIFKTKFNLNIFPFDTQRLDIKIRLLDSKYYNSSNCFTLDKLTIKSNSFNDEWDLLEPIINIDFDDIHPMIIYSIIISRKWFYYFINIIVIQFFIITLNFYTFIFSYGTNLSTDSAFNLVLILTTFSFRSSFNSLMPKVSDLTIIDIYYLGGLIIQFLIFVLQMTPLFFESHLTNTTISDNTYYTIFKYTFYITGLIWLLFNLIIFIYLKTKYTVKKIIKLDKNIIFNITKDESSQFYEVKTSE